MPATGFVGRQSGGSRYGHVLMCQCEAMDVDDDDEVL